MHVYLLMLGSNHELLSSQQVHTQHNMGRQASSAEVLSCRCIILIPRRWVSKVRLIVRPLGRPPPNVAVALGSYSAHRAQ